MARILVIDDNPGARLFAAAALGRAGHTVTELEPTCLYKALEALHLETPDLLIADLVMPGCPGQTLIRACREDGHLKNLRILLLTANGSPAIATFLQTMGNVHYLAKPVSPIALTDCVERLLGQEPETDPGWALACNGVVAVVDDSQLSRAYHAACLRKSGFRPVAIEPLGLLETVLEIEKAQPQLLLVDFLMPEFNGDALIRALRGRGSLRDVPVLVVTAHKSDEFAQLALRLDGVEILFKPVGPEELVGRVRAILQS